MRSVWADIIGQLLKDARISQRQLAKLSGVGRSALRRMLAGGDPPLSVVERILDVLEYDLDAIPRPLGDKSPTTCKELQGDADRCQ
jgi:transcriptional regulator with XRE-family HTH domain